MANGKRSRKKDQVEERKKEIYDLWQQGFSMSRIGKAMGMNHTTVLFHLRKAGVDTHRSWKKPMLLKIKKERTKKTKPTKYIAAIKLNQRMIKVYQKILREQYSKRFIRDKKGILIKVEKIPYIRPR